MTNDFFTEQMNYLSGLAHFTPAKVVSGEYEFSLDAIKELLFLAGNPQDRLKIIHVAGTNGKGSTIAFLSKILQEANYRVGVYTSPALISVTEQISINGINIDRDSFACLINELRPHIDYMMSCNHKITTEFETITVAALLYFLRQNCDFVLLECGLGGTLDATNVISSSVLSVITSIGLDHTEILGDTPEKIASQKAGIIKKNGTAVVMEAAESIINVFSQKCLLENARLLIAPSSDEVLSNIPLGLKGMHQISNASLAQMCALELRNKGYEISDEAIYNGLCKAVWPCRFEIIGQNPTFVIDGSHNTDGVNALINSLTHLWPNQKFRFIIGILRDKSYEQILDMVIPIAVKFYAVTVPSQRALPAEELNRALLLKGAVSQPFDTIEEAVDMAVAESGNDDIICAFGSLYYVGKVRNHILTE